MDDGKRVDVAVEPEKGPLTEVPLPGEVTSLSWWRRSPSYLLLLGALLLNLSLFLYLAVSYQGLPAEVPLHIDEAGRVERVGAPSALFILPLSGAIAWIINGLLGWLFYHRRRERPMALIIWGGTIALQVAAWGAVLQLMGVL